jgi:hypothetical protein
MKEIRKQKIKRRKRNRSKKKRRTAHLGRNPAHSPANSKPEPVPALSLSLAAMWDPHVITYLQPRFPPEIDPKTAVTPLLNPYSSLPISTTPRTYKKPWISSAPPLSLFLLICRQADAISHRNPADLPPLIVDFDKTVSSRALLSGLNSLPHPRTSPGTHHLFHFMQNRRRQLAPEALAAVSTSSLASFPFQEETDDLENAFKLTSAHRIPSCSSSSPETTGSASSSKPEPPNLASVDPAVSTSPFFFASRRI